jgi:predicted GNAT superfamily acetyltransferase
MHACEQLYADVMGLRAEDGSINPRLLIALQHNGGYVIGSFLDRRVIGFAYSFLGSDRSREVGGDLYQYSQLAVVAQAMQGKGIGRLLKLKQRERCLADGIGHMKWAYDPLLTRNGHFNLDVLGARVVAFVPAMYGGSGFGTYTGDATDRFIVEWVLKSETSRPVDGSPPPGHWSPGMCFQDGDDLLIAVPGQWDRLRDEVGFTAAADIRLELQRAFTHALDTGRVGVSCQASDQGMALYRFAFPASMCDR